MTDTLSPPQSPPRQRARPRRGAVVRTAVAQAAGAAAVGLVLCLSVVLVGWATDGRSSGSVAAILRAAARLWLVAHRVPVDLPAGRLVLAPVGLTLLVLAFVVRAASTAVRRTGAARRRDSLAAGLAVAVPYALIVAGVSRLAAGAGFRPSPAGGLVAALVLGGAACLAGWVRALGWASAAHRLPRHAAAVGRATAGAVGVLLASGALLAAASLAADAGRAGRLAGSVAGGAPAGFALLLTQLALVPNAVVWGAAYSLAAGFAVGVGTLVAPTGVTVGAVPALPLLAALPQSGAAPTASLLALCGPALAALVGGVLLARALPDEPTARLAGWTLAVAVSVAAVMGGLALLASGAAPGRLAELGPAPLVTAAAAGAWIVALGVPAVWVTRLRSRPREG